MNTIGHIRWNRDEAIGENDAPIDVAMRQSQPVDLERRLSAGEVAEIDAALALAEEKRLPPRCRFPIPILLVIVAGKEEASLAAKIAPVGEVIVAADQPPDMRPQRAITAAGGVVLDPRFAILSDDGRNCHSAFPLS